MRDALFFLSHLEAEDIFFVSFCDVKVRAQMLSSCPVKSSSLASHLKSFSSYWGSLPQSLLSFKSSFLYLSTRDLTNNFPSSVVCFPWNTVLCKRSTINAELFVFIICVLNYTNFCVCIGISFGQLKTCFFWCSMGKFPLHSFFLILYR